MYLNILETTIIFIVAFGFVLLCFGVFYSKYPREGRFRNLKTVLNIEAITGSRPIKPILDLISGNRNGNLYKLTSRVITLSETNISVQALFFLKIISLFAVAVITLLIQYTNIDVIKLSIISKPQESFSIFQDLNVQDYSRNISLYNAVVKRIGEDALKKLDSSGKLEEAKKVLPSLLQTNDSDIVEEKANTFVNTYNAVSRVRLFDWKVVLVILASFWLPELILLLKYLLLGSMYWKEVIKLENIFELLGSIKGFKTINIIEEMGKSSKAYTRHLRNCLALFKTEKELALESLKSAVKNSRFSKLVDVMRVYAMIDKRLAIQILERNKLEKEEELLLTAEEDIDMVDLIAFISIVPILLELANLLMKPMLDMIYEAFKFI